MKFDYTSINLPVKEVIPDIKSGLEKSNTLILKAPPGAGKSTLVPLTLLEENWLKGNKIIVLEPRRLAARSIAERMASFLNEKVGETVGYRIRFDTKVSAKTKIEIVTEGILTRMLHQNNDLEGVGLVVFDEFHERSLHADLSMALTRESQAVLRNDLRILVMSATIETNELSNLLQAKVIESKGKLFPVKIEYTGENDVYLIPELVAKLIKDVVEKHQGDILVFLPGQSEIKRSEAILKRTLKNVFIYPLYGQLHAYQQQLAILPNKEGKRKIVLATNIAETSLTIEGVKIVIDSGFERVSKFNPNTSLSKLETILITKDSADQRAGRAGRLSPGLCYRMWSQATQNRLEDNRKPEIEQADLTSLMLDLIGWGVNNPEELIWVTPPPKLNIVKAKDLLKELDIVEDGKLTEHGKKVHQLPTHPRIAHMLIKAKELNLIGLATDLAAIIEEKDPLPNENEVDINIRIEALRKLREENRLNKQFIKIEKIANQYRKLLTIEVDNSLFTDYETGLLLAFAFPERIACSRPGNNAVFQMANGKLATLGFKDNLAYEQWIAISNINDRQGIGKIFLASPLDPKDLKELVKTKENISWDSKNGELITSTELRIGSIVLKSTPIKNINNEKILQLLIDLVKKDGEKLLNWNKEVEQWQNRILSLKKWDNEYKWPDVSIENLLITAEEWILPYLTNIKTIEDFKAINLAEILHYSLTAELQKRLLELAPQKIKVPSGSIINLEYQKNGSDPVLAVRLQECFGLTETPRVYNNQINVLMHLLSPGYKVVQITSDLKSFWNSGYFEVRKDLRMKYKKHYWPENPLEVQAIKGSKKQNNIK